MSEIHPPADEERPVDGNGNPIERREGYVSPRRYLIASLGMAALFFLGIAGLYYEGTTNSAEARREIEKESARADYRICVEANETRLLIRDFIIDTYEQSLNSINNISYYRTHPNEAEEVRKRTERQLERVSSNFSPLNCEEISLELERGRG